MDYSLYATATPGKRLAAYLVDMVPIIIIVLCYYYWVHGFSIWDVQLKKENPEGYATLRSAVRLHAFGFWALLCFILLLCSILKFLAWMWAVNSQFPNSKFQMINLELLVSKKSQHYIFREKMFVFALTVFLSSRI